MRIGQDLLDLLAARIQHLGLGRDDLLFPSTEKAGGNPVSRNTFRTRVWLPSLAKAKLGHQVRMHELRELPPGRALYFASGTPAFLLHPRPWWTGPHADTIRAAISSAGTEVPRQRKTGLEARVPADREHQV